MQVEALPFSDPLSSVPGLELELVHKWLVWDAYTAGKRRVDLHPFVLGDALHRSAVDIAEAAWRLVMRAGERDENSLYRFHPDVERLATASRDANDQGGIARVDLLLGEDGKWVACEVNADCPGGFNESIALPRLARIAGATQRSLPCAVEALADALVAKAKGGLIALAYATGYAEDLQICAIVERLVRERGGRTVRVSPTMLKSVGDGVGVRGQQIAVLYRFYPLEYMIEQRNLDAIEAAVRNRTLVTMSSFAHIHAQSKLAMARAFVHEPEEAEHVFAETFELSEIDRSYLLSDRPNWVVKRDLSRVGDHVYVGSLIDREDFRGILEEIAGVDDQAWIAQRYVPQKPIPTPWGERLITLGVYLLDGRFCGYFARFSKESHCSHDALVLPVFG
jgi:glutathionylspermidine synthase